MTQPALLDMPRRKTPTGPTLDSRALLDMLRRQYLPDNRPAGGIFAPEITSPCGKRRADLIWMPTTIAGGRGLHGHEVKVTRTDLLTELADPAKADPWAQYCSRLWLVIAHPTLIAGLDIPDPWGVMAPPSERRTRTMTILKPAPKLAPHEPGPGIARLAAWQMYTLAERTARLQADMRHKDREIERLRAAVAQLRASGARCDDPWAQKVARIITAAKQRAAAAYLWDDIDEETAVAAIVDSVATTHAAEATRQRLRGLINDVGRVLAPFEYVTKDIERAERIAAELAGGKP